MLGVMGGNDELAGERLGNDWKPPHLDEIIKQEVPLNAMETVFNDMMKGRSVGRTVVKIGE